MRAASVFRLWGDAAFTLKTPTVTMMPVGLAGHTDLESLGNRIGVRIDWSQPDLKHE